MFGKLLCWVFGHRFNNTINIVAPEWTDIRCIQCDTWFKREEVDSTLKCKWVWRRY